MDLASQLVISLSEHLMKQKSDSYPIGRARLEALGVIGCACIMSMASLEVGHASATMGSAFALVSTSQASEVIHLGHAGDSVQLHGSVGRICQQQPHSHSGRPAHVPDPGHWNCCQAGSVPILQAISWLGLDCRVGGRSSERCFLEHRRHRHSNHSCPRAQLLVD